MKILSTRLYVIDHDLHEMLDLPMEICSGTHDWRYALKELTSSEEPGIAALLEKAVS